MTGEGIIDKDMAYQEFSYDFIKTWCNTDVENYITGLRKEDNALSQETTYYHGIETMAKYFLKKEHKECLNYEGK